MENLMLKNHQTFTKCVQRIHEATEKKTQTNSFTLSGRNAF